MLKEICKPQAHSDKMRLFFFHFHFRISFSPFLFSLHGGCKAPRNSCVYAQLVCLVCLSTPISPVSTRVSGVRVETPETPCREKRKGRREIRKWKMKSLILWNPPVPDRALVCERDGAVVCQGLCTRVSSAVYACLMPLALRSCVSCAHAFACQGTRQGSRVSNLQEQATTLT